MRTASSPTLISFILLLMINRYCERKCAAAIRTRSHKGKVMAVLYKNKITINLNDICIWLIYIYILATLFTPVDTFKFKKITFAALFILSFFDLYEKKIEKDMLYMVFFGFLFPAILILITIIEGVSFGSAVSRGFAGLYVCFYFIIRNRHKQFEVMLMQMLRIMALSICVSALLDLTHILTIENNPLMQWMHTSENAMIGKGSNFAFYYLLFYKTSPLLFIMLGYATHKKKYFDIVLSAAAIFLSGTRANVFVLAAVLAALFVFTYKNKKYKYHIILAGVVVGLCLLPLVLPKIIEVFREKSDSDAVRNGHLISIFQLFRDNPVAIFFGTGFDSYFYSSGVKANINIIELSYWDLLRQVGLFGLLPFMFFYIYPIFKLWKTDYRHVAITLAAFLIISYTNPFLYSSTGALYMVYAYTKVYRSYCSDHNCNIITEATDGEQNRIDHSADI